MISGTMLIRKLVLLWIGFLDSIVRCLMYERYYLQKPDLSSMGVFGSQCYFCVHSLDCQRNCVSDPSVPGIFLGYDEHQRSYKVLLHGKQLLMYSHSVIFDEHVFRQKCTAPSA